MNAREIALRVIIAVAAAATTVLGAPPLVAAPIGIASVVATSELAARIPTRPARERAMLAAGFPLVALVLLSLLLNTLPWGLTPASWSVSWAIGSLVAIALRHRTPRGWRIDRPSPRAFAWLLPPLVIVLAAVALSLRGTVIEDQPPLALGLLSRSASAATVSVDAGSHPGDYRIRVAAPGTSAVLGPPFTLQRSEHRKLSVPLAAGAPNVISLLDARTGLELRRVTAG
jgi:hypothetical protein